MRQRYQKFFPLSLAIFLFLGGFWPNHFILAVTREDCDNRGEATFRECIDSSQAGDGVSSDPDPETLDQCNGRRDTIVLQCLDEIIELDTTENKEGCYCIIAPPADDIASDVKREKKIPENNTKERCGGGMQLPSGETVIECKWYAPSKTDTDKEKSLELPAGISGLNKLGVSTPQEFIGRLIKAAMGVMGTIALAVLVYAGVLWMTAAGNSDRERKALDIMFWGALGVLVILSSYTIVQFIVGNALVP